MSAELSLVEMAKLVIESYVARGYVDGNPCLDCRLYDRNHKICYSPNGRDLAKARELNYCPDHEVANFKSRGLFPGISPVSGIDQSTSPLDLDNDK